VYLISVFKYNLDKNKLLRVKQICRKFGNNCRIALHEDVITGKDEVYHQYLKYLELRLRVSICEYLKGSLTDEERLIYSAPSAIAVLEPSDDDIRQRRYNLVFPSFYVKRELQDIVKRKGKAFLTTFLGEMRDRPEFSPAVGALFEDCSLQYLRNSSWLTFRSLTIPNGLRLVQLDNKLQSAPYIFKKFSNIEASIRYYRIWPPKSTKFSAIDAFSIHPREKNDQWLPVYDFI
jgi:hypothetical protein